MIGMMASHISNKNKEIGVRKVFGAHSSNIITFLLRDIVKIVVIAYAVTLPIAIIVMNKWGEKYAYQVEISALTYFLIGLFYILLPTLILFYQSYKASINSPIKILRLSN